MSKHLCQGPKCHTYKTQSRIRGPKDSKVLRTRFARQDTLQEKYDWLNNWEYFFCDERCMNNWLDVHMTQLISFVGLKTKPDETPIVVEKETLQGWRGTYVDTTIKLLNSNAVEDIVIT
jgi:hypothetical protein